MTDAGRCAVVGAGPAGVMLSLLLARRGVPVTLLESHANLDRDFRGDTIHPSTLELLDQIGLAAPLHRLPHTKLPELRLVTPSGIQTLVVFRRLRTRFPYVMLMPQATFLEFLIARAAEHPHFELITGATVDRLVEEQGIVRGVGYLEGGRVREVRAALTVAADGRFSRLRRLAGMEPIPQSEPMDVLWLRLPRLAGDPPDEAAIVVGGGCAIVLLGRVGEWQVGYVGRKGSFPRLKSGGIDAFRRLLAGRIPWLADRVGLLQEWTQVSVLSVAADRLRRWDRAGLLFVGDAAHTMLPVAGVGINCAIADVVETVNICAAPLRRGSIDPKRLAEVQRRREGPTRMIQRFQRLAQRRIIEQAVSSVSGFRLPLGLRIVRRLPLARDLPGRLVGLGLRRVRLEHVG